MHNVIKQTVPHISKNEFAQIISCTIFCNLKSLPLVVRVGDVVKFGIAAKSYLPDSFNLIPSNPPTMQRWYRANCLTIRVL